MPRKYATKSRTRETNDPASRRVSDIALASFEDGNQESDEVEKSLDAIHLAIEQPYALKQYSDEDNYKKFMQNLAELDSEKTTPSDRQESKTRLLSDFYNHFKGLPASEILRFGKQLQEDIRAHEQIDSLDKAFHEDRIVYRSWHQPGRISESVNLGAMVEGGRELVGADSLNVALDPARFINHKRQTKGPGFIPLGAAPSSVLYRDQQNVVFRKDQGTATALLPENLYAGFSAYNESAKFLLRDTSHQEGRSETDDLREHSKYMRALITRPIFFDTDDIQSSTGGYRHPSKEGVHVRKTHAGLHEDHNPLNESLELKLDDLLRSNALFYQTFSQHSKSNSHAGEWNEMVVKYRSTGHMAGLHKNIREWVPGLKSHPAIDDVLEDSGKFSAEKAKQEDVRVAPLVGKNFDLVIEKKKKGK